MGITRSQVAAVPFVERTDYEEPSIFLPENMLREARRQRGLSHGNVPEVCLLDPDGDIVRYLIREERAQRSASWACYHTELWEATNDHVRIGIVGGAVGASFAVLVAEELFASGCRFLVSLSSAGQIAADLNSPCVILIDRALRGEGTSHAYLPPAPTVDADQDLVAAVEVSLEHFAVPTRRGISWTTDAPFRETATALATARAAGASVVEMEAAALYAFAAACHRPVICFAHVTNTMGVGEADFEKGPADGALQALRVLDAATRAWSPYRQQGEHREQDQP
ncbi:MAG TPA: nucleoside phosphorylase [Thermomicrobiales bacterium]|nr:nucleoside phosphorylase [Thermomicrobiales bacterium]